MVHSKTVANPSKMKKIPTIITFVTVLVGLTSSLNVTRPATSGDRDSFTNPKCDWQECLKLSAACKTAECCECTCNTGTTYLAQNGSCIPEDQITKGCNIMAQTSGTPPWSFVPVTITSIKNLRSGLNIFHCTKSSCVKADGCRITNIIYEDMGWKMFPSNADSEFRILRNHLTINGKECFDKRFLGLLLSMAVNCKVNRQVQNTKTTACLIMKISGQREVGKVPDLNYECNTNNTVTTVIPRPSFQIPWYTLHSASDIVSTTKQLSTTIFQMESYHATTSMSSEYLAVKSTDVLMTKTKESNTITNEIIQPSTSIPSATNELTTRQANSRNEGTMKITTKAIELQTAHSIVRIQKTTTGFLGVNSSTVRSGSRRSKQNIQITKVVESPPSSSGKNADAVIDRYVLISSIIAGSAFLCIIILVIISLIIRRKRNQISENTAQAISCKLPVDQQILKNKRFRSGMSPPNTPPPLPPIIKLRSVQRHDSFYNKTSDKINLSNSWKSKQEEDTDDEYDIPADPPGMQRSFSSLYSKVDLSQINYAAERDDIYTSIDSRTSTLDSHNGTNMYDEPESIIGQSTSQGVTKRLEELPNDEFEKYLRIS